MLIPYRTDAPVYHFPWATLALIAVNLVLFIGWHQDTFDLEPWILDYSTFNPIQWITSNFIHASWDHLIGNMAFLWIFGLVVEGKIGALKFLAIVSIIALPQNMIEQLVFFEGGSYGASSIVFGLMAICWIWAPHNDVTFFWTLFLRGGTFDAKLQTTTIAFVALQLYWLSVDVSLFGLGASTELLHLLGFFLGLPVGIVMVKKGWVDCEDWDWFSIRRGDHHKKALFAHRRQFGASELDEEDLDVDVDADVDDPEIELELLRDSIAAGDANSAFEIFEEFRGDLPEADERHLIDLLYDSEMWSRCRRLAVSHIRRYPNVASVRLKLAVIIIRQQQQPSLGLKLLSTVATNSLSAEDLELHAQLSNVARQLARKGVLEFADDEQEW